jgi:peptidoglycan/LPS O-acetylase OafA/YrhL
MAAAALLLLYWNVFNLPAMHFRWIDFAKGYAIFTIVCYHALQRVELPSALAQAIVFGGTGVHLFFMLSGFGLSLSRKTMSPLDFYRRRLIKIWLPYMAVLTLSLAGALTLGLFPNGWSEWLAGVGLYQMFHEPWIQSFGGHFWFISAIIQLYLVFPLLTRIQKKVSNPLYFFIGGLVISVGWWCFVWLSGKGDLRIWNSFFLQFLWEFALGMALAEAYKNPEKSTTTTRLFAFLQNPNPWGWLLVGVLGSGLMIAMILKMGAVGKIFNDVPALLGYTALCIFLYRFGQRWLPFIPAFFLWISGFSFSLYLVHVLVLELFLLVVTGSIAHEMPLHLSILYLPVALLGGWLFEPINKALVREDRY